MKRQLAIFVIIMTLALLSLLTGCSADAGGQMSTRVINGGSSAEVDAGDPNAGSTDSGSTVPATFETVEFIITQAPCFGAGCHNDDQNPLDLRVNDELYTRLTSGTSMNCGDVPIVNPGEPQGSALVKILKGPCGPTPRMPPGCVDDTDGACVPAEYIAAIEQWIAIDAPQQ